MIAVIPSTSAILNIFDPKAFPTLSPGCLSKAAKPETNISGAEVPKPKISIPIMSGLTL